MKNPNLKIRAVAKVQVTLEVDADLWGGDCSIGQLYDQASEAGRNAIFKLLSDVCDYRDKQPLNVRVIGEPKVIGIITEELR